MGHKKKGKPSKAKKSSAKTGPGSQVDAATEEAMFEAAIADSKETAGIAGIASAEESAVSSAVEASLESSKQENQEAQQEVGDDEGDNDIRLDEMKDEATATGVEKCDHVKHAVKTKDFRRLKIKDWDHCRECLNLQAPGRKVDAEATGDSDESLPLDALWMCMSCQSINCGLTARKHAKAHHQTKGHDHPIAINLGNLDCWCYECDNYLMTSGGKNPTVSECRSLLTKELQARQSRMRAASIAHSKKSKGAVASTPTPAAAPVKAKVLAPGLQNLGNTCFFNSVMQILVETKSLKAILSEKGRPDFQRSLAVETDSGVGPLTDNFKDFLSTTWKQKGGIVAPRDLFQQIAKKWRMFRGFRQQDSQELMRHLFDGIREEEKELIKKTVGENPTSATDGDDANLPKYVPFIDSCFAGKLVSVIVCHSCKKCSYAYEDYFDLSLPVKDTDREALDNDAVPSTSKDEKADAEKGPELEFILRKAYKRYLVSSLPPTLVLHLKRFEQSSSRFGLMRKIDDHVEIPIEIDMEPYCISRSQLEEGEISAEGDSKEKVSKRYRLYGATVHQGSLASGHYTNFVLSSKVDMPPPPEKEKASSAPEPPAVASNGVPDVSLADMMAQTGKKSKKKVKSAGGTNAAAATTAAASSTDKQPDVDKGPPASQSTKSEGKEQADGREWIYCSDTHVRFATLQEVLASRPYLLYYERC
ncbi:MAG: hypothetical protein J3Q66DRAFT_319819 [Benniella sp.]|nr:MAG: hypothetical protein J3Q66DRAFT_319819 [Benniella sp.]